MFSKYAYIYHRQKASVLQGSTVIIFTEFINTHRHIVVCANKGIGQTRCACQYRTHSKVGDLDFTSVVYQQIWRFQIPVDNMFFMVKIPQALEYLVESKAMFSNLSKFFWLKNELHFPTCLQIAARHGSGILWTFFKKSARDPPSMYSKIMETAPLS